MGTRVHTRNYEYNQTIYNVNKPPLSLRLDESFLYVSTIEQKYLSSRTLAHTCSRVMNFVPKKIRVYHHIYTLC